MTVLPTGRQFTLVLDDAEVVVVEVGAGLRSYRAGGRELLDGYREDEMAESFRGAVLAPWPNRLRDGRYTWEGVEHQTALSEPDKGAALHGLVHSAAWTPVQQEPSRVVLEHVLHPQLGYPFTLRLRITYALGAGGLDVRSEATNVGTVPLPYGEGHHPYLAAGPGRVDACHLVSPAATYLEADERGIPTGSAAVAGTPYDFRAGRTVGDLRLDHAFTDLARDERGRAWVRLTGPDGRGAAVWMDEGYRWLQLFSADTVAPARRRRGLAVEPMTCPPDALRTGEGVRRLEPGSSRAGSGGISPVG